MGEIRYKKFHKKYNFVVSIQMKLNMIIFDFDFVQGTHKKQYCCA